MRAAFRWRLKAAVASISIAAALGAGAARAEWAFSVYGGSTSPRETDVHLLQHGGTDLRFHDVDFEGRDFESPWYWGARILRFDSAQSHWGFGVEYVHAKMHVDESQRVRTTGTRDGVPVDEVERIDETIQQFSISHGLNLFTADVLYRWFPDARGRGRPRRFQPYVGGGIGWAVPHVELRMGEVDFQEYQWHGPVLQGLGGLAFALDRHLALFTELKLVQADLKGLDVPGGSIGLEPRAYHWVLGVSFTP